MCLATREALAGRVKERSVLDQMIAGLAGGRGSLCWLRGEPGIGKSALIDAVITQAGELGYRTLRGAADELATAAPLRLMASCLGVYTARDPVSAEIAGLLDADPVAVLAAGERMLELVDAMCAEGPVVLAVEDMQWADEPSLLLWNRLARVVNEIPLVLLGTARAAPRRAQLDRLRELTERCGAVLELAPLSPAEARTLAGAVTGGAPGPRLSAVVAKTGGNPLYITELANALIAGDLIEVTGDEAELRAGMVAVPASLTAIIENRLRYLPEDVRAAVRIAAVLGPEFSAGEWAIATGHSVVQMAEMVEAADGLLDGTGDHLRFRHQVVQEALAGRVPAAARAALRVEIAEKLVASGHGVDTVARHLLAARDTVDGWARSWLAKLPESAFYASPVASAELLERAVAADENDALATPLARVLFWLRRDDRASELAESVARRTSDQVLAARMRILVLRSAIRSNRTGQVAWALTGQPGDDELPGMWRARLAAWSAQLLRAAGRPAQGAGLARRSVLLAEASGDPVALACARYALAMCGSGDNRPALIENALTALPGRDAESLELRVTLAASRIVQSADLGRRADGDTVLRDGLLLAEQAGAIPAAPVLAAAAYRCYRYGRWDDALDYLARLGQSKWLAPYLGISAVIALRRGDLATADAWTRDMAAASRTSYPLARVRALRAEADGDCARACDLESGWLRAAPPGRHAGLPWLVRLALEIGDGNTVNAAVAASQADAADDGSPGRVAAARLCQALADGDAAGLLAVADDCDRHGWLPMRASALEEAAVLLARAGETVRARSSLTSAARGYADLGAVWDLHRADTRLKHYGVRRGPNSIRRRPSAGWDALTPAERRVAELVGQGRSNSEIAERLVVSPRTVHTHVGRILAKLGLSSRVEIVRVVAGRQD